VKRVEGVANSETGGPATNRGNGKGSRKAYNPATESSVAQEQE